MACLLVWRDGVERFFAYVGMFGSLENVVAASEMGTAVATAASGYEFSYFDGSALHLMDKNSIAGLDPDVELISVRMNAVGDMWVHTRNTITNSGRSYIVSPVPEPSILAVLAIGFGGTLLRCRRGR